jgi:hypothetical protein
MLQNCQFISKPMDAPFFEIRSVRVGQKVSNPFAIRLSVLHCFSCTSVPPVALQVVECKFSRGFESYLGAILSERLLKRCVSRLSRLRAFFTPLPRGRELCLLRQPCAVIWRVGRPVPLPRRRSGIASSAGGGCRAESQDLAHSRDSLGLLRRTPPSHEFADHR